MISPFLALINEFLGQPPNASEEGFQIDHILEFSHWFMGALFVGWSLFFIFVLIRFRKSRQPVADYQGVKSGISTHLEFAVVLIEAVLLIGFAIPIWAKYVNKFPDDKEAILVHAIGQQFSWNFHMPGPDGQFGRRDVSLVSNSNPLGLDPQSPEGKDDLVVLGELHVPVNRPVIVETSSKDVIHNFAVPHMRVAQDAIPGQIIPLWFTPIKTGTYEVVCGQLCGLGHYGMKGTRRRRYAGRLSGLAKGTGRARRDRDRPGCRRERLPARNPESGAPKAGDPTGTNPAATPSGPHPGA